MTNDKISEALEQARCAISNLDNLVTLVPILKDQPMVQVVRIQIEETIRILEGQDDKR